LLTRGHINDDNDVDQPQGSNDDTRLMKLWRDACKTYYGPDALPPHADSGKKVMDIVSTETSAKFPGFTMINTVVNGCLSTKKKGSFILPSSGSNLPRRNFHRPEEKGEIENKEASELTIAPLSFWGWGQQEGRFSSSFVSRQSSSSTEKKSMKDEDDDVVHRFYLIADSKRLEGPRPVTWLAQTLMGRGDGSKGSSSSSSSFQPSETKASSRISVVAVKGEPDVESNHETNHNHGGAVTSKVSSPTSSSHGFQIEVDCTVQIEFPKFLLRLLPTSQAKVEESGTQAVQKAVLQDVSAAVAAVEKAWWMHRTTSINSADGHQTP